MIAWIVETAFEYVPMLANAIDDTNPEQVRIGQWLPSATVERLQDTLERSGPPLVWDFSGIEWPEDHSFGSIRLAKRARDVYCVRLSSSCRQRIQDDTGKAFTYCGKSSLGHVLSCCGGEYDKGLIRRGSRRSSIIRHYAMNAIRPFIRDNPKHEPCHSEDVCAPKYFNAKLLYGRQPEARVLSTALALAINDAKLPNYHLVLASSYTGSLVATNVAYLLNKPVACLVNLGPTFVLKNRVGWDSLKRAHALLVVDMVRLGTETRVAQATLAVHSGRLVGVAGLAQYARVKNIKSVSLLRKTHLKELGYSLAIK